jgi:hypothetical protein
LVERLRQRAAALSDTGTALSKQADATEPLYKSLDDKSEAAVRIAHPPHRPEMNSVATAMRATGLITGTICVGSRAIASATTA